MLLLILVELIVRYFKYLILIYYNIFIRYTNLNIKYSQMLHLNEISKLLLIKILTAIVTIKLIEQSSNSIEEVINLLSFKNFFEIVFILGLIIHEFNE